MNKIFRYLISLIILFLLVGIWIIPDRVNAAGGIEISDDYVLPKFYPMSGTREATKFNVKSSSNSQLTVTFKVKSQFNEIISPATIIPAGTTKEFRNDPYSYIVPATIYSGEQHITMIVTDGNETVTKDLGVIYYDRYSFCNLSYNSIDYTSMTWTPGTVVEVYFQCYISLAENPTININGTEIELKKSSDNGIYGSTHYIGYYYITNETPPGSLSVSYAPSFTSVSGNEYTVSAGTPRSVDKEPRGCKASIGTLSGKPNFIFGDRVILSLHDKSDEVKCKYETITAIIGGTYTTESSMIVHDGKPSFSTSISSNQLGDLEFIITITYSSGHTERIMTTYDGSKVYQGYSYKSDTAPILSSGGLSQRTQYEYAALGEWEGIETLKVYSLKDPDSKIVKYGDPVVVEMRLRSERGSFRVFHTVTDDEMNNATAGLRLLGDTYIGIFYNKHTIGSGQPIDLKIREQINSVADVRNNGVPLYGLMNLPASFEGDDLYLLGPETDGTITFPNTGMTYNTSMGNELAIVAEINPIEIIDSDLTKMNPIAMRYSSGSSAEYKPLLAKSISGNKVTFSTIVDSSWRQNTTYRLHSPTILDAGGRSLRLHGSIDHITSIITPPPPATWEESTIISYEDINPKFSDDSTVLVTFKVKDGRKVSSSDLPVLTLGNGANPTLYSIDGSNITYSYSNTKGLGTVDYRISGGSTVDGGLLKEMNGSFKPNPPFIFDKDITSMNITSNNVNDNSIARMGDTVVVSLTTTVNANLPSKIEINGESIRARLQSGIALYDYTVTKDSPLGLVKVLIENEGEIYTEANSKTQVVIEDLINNGWEYVKLKGNNGEFLEFEDRVLFEAKASGLIIGTPTLSINGRPIKVKVNGDMITAEYVVSLDTPFGKTSFSLENVNTTSGSGDIDFTTDGIYPSYSSNADKVISLSSYTSDDRGDFARNGEYITFLYEMGGEILVPGRVHFLEEGSSKSYENIILGNNLIGAIIPKNEGIADKGQVIRLVNARISVDGKGTSVSHVGYPRGTVADKTSSYVNYRPEVNIYSEDGTLISDTYVSNSLPFYVEAVFPEEISEILSLPDKVLTNVISGDYILGYKMEGNSVKFKVKSGQVYNFLEIGLSGLEILGSDGISYRVTEDYGPTNIHLVSWLGAATGNVGRITISPKMESSYVYTSYPTILAEGKGKIEFAYEGGAYFIDAPIVSLGNNRNITTTLNVDKTVATANFDFESITEAEEIWVVLENDVRLWDPKKGNVYAPKGLRSLPAGNPYLVPNEIPEVTKFDSGSVSGTLRLVSRSYFVSDSSMLPNRVILESGSDQFYNVNINSSMITTEHRYWSDRPQSTVIVKGPVFRNSKHPKLEYFYPDYYVAGKSTTYIEGEEQVSIMSDNELSPRIAFDDDRIFVHAKYKGQLDGLTDGTKILDDWVAGQYLSQDRTTYSAYRYVEEYDPEGLVDFRVGGLRMISGASSRLLRERTETTDGSSVTILRLNKRIHDIQLSTDSGISPLVRVGDSVTLKFKYNDSDLNTKEEFSGFIGNYEIGGELKEDNEITFIASEEHLDEGLISFAISLDVPNIGPVSFNKTTDGSSLEFITDRLFLAESVTIKSDSDYSPEHATNGDTITATLVYPEDVIYVPEVRLAGRRASVTKTGKVLTAEITVENLDREGLVDIQVDVNPNGVTQHFATIKTTDKSSVRIKLNVEFPKLTSLSVKSNNSESEFVATEGDIITLELKLNQEIAVAPVVWIDGKAPLDLSIVNNVLKYTFKVDKSYTPGIAEILVKKNGESADGYVFGGYTETTDGSYVEILKMFENIELISSTIYSDNSKRWLAKEGDTVFIDLVFNRDVDFIVPNLIGQRLEIDHLDEGVYRLSAKVAYGYDGYAIPSFLRIEGEGSDTTLEGFVSSTDGSSVLVDTKRPEIDSVSVSNSYPVVGDTVAVSVLFNEEIGSNPVVRFSGVNVSVSLDSDGYYVGEFIYTQQMEDALPLDLVINDYYDLAGNAGDEYCDDSLIKLGVMQEVKINHVILSTDRGEPVVDVGDTVELEIKADGELTTVESVLFGDSPAVTTEIYGDTLTARYEIKASDPDGKLNFSVMGLSSKRNRINPIFATTDGSTIEVLKSVEYSLILEHSTFNSGRVSVNRALTVGDIVQVVAIISEPVSFLELSDTNGKSYELITAERNRYVFEREIEENERNGAVVIEPTRVLRGTEVVYPTFNGTSFEVDTLAPEFVNYSLGDQTRLNFNEPIKHLKVKFDDTILEDFGTGTSIAIPSGYEDSLYVEILSVSDNSGNESYNFLVWDNLHTQSTSTVMITLTGVADEVGYRDFAIPVFTAASSKSDSVEVNGTLNGAPFISGTPVTEIGNYVLIIHAVDSLGNEDSLTTRFDIR